MEQVLEKAAKECGALRLFDNPSLFLLHMLQHHWIPDLYSMLACLHTRDVLDNVRIHLNKFRTTLNKCSTHYRLPVSTFLVADEVLHANGSHIFWSKVAIRDMANQNFVQTFTQWQLLSTRKIKNDPKCGNRNFIYYGDDLAEVGCTQVVITSLEEVEAEGSNQGGSGQFNYKDKHTDYGYHSCFTRNKDFNYSTHSTLKRCIYTKDAFDTLINFNPIETADWPSNYMPMVEEVMNVSASVYNLMYKHLAGPITMHTSSKLYQYKYARMADAKANWETRRNYQKMVHGRTSILDEDEDMVNDEEISADGYHGNGEKVPLHSTANDSGLATGSTPELPHTPAHTDDASTISENANIGNDQTPADSGIDWAIMLPRANNGAFLREFQSLFGSAANTTKEKQAGMAGIADDFDVYGSISMFMERYHERRHEQMLHEHFEPAQVEMMVKIDRALKNTIWKEDLKKLVKKNIMQVLGDSDAMNDIFRENPQCLMKAFEMMATNENVLQKLETVTGFKDEWLTKMQVSIVKAIHKKSNANAGNASANLQEGLSPITAQNSRQAAHNTSNEDVPIASSHTFRTDKKFGGYELGGKKKSNK